MLADAQDERAGGHHERGSAELHADFPAKQVSERRAYSSEQQKSKFQNLITVRERRCLPFAHNVVTTCSLSLARRNGEFRSEERLSSRTKTEQRQILVTPSPYQPAIPG